MNINSESDLILILRLEDKKGELLRASQCLSLKVKVFTDDERYCLIFTKSDIDTSGEYDKIKIERDDLEKLESGVIRYCAEWSTLRDPEYQKSRVYTTDIYFANDAIDLEHPENIINWKTIEKLKDAIAKVGADCELEIAKINRYIKEEYENKLNEEIRRSTDVDIRFFELIKELQDKAQESGTDITEINSILEELKAKDIELDTNIQAVSDRLDSFKSRTESVEKDLDFRLDSTESRLNVLQDSNPNTPGSLLNLEKRANAYTDETFKDARKGLATIEELEAVNNKITPHPTRLSDFINDVPYVRKDDDLLGSFYTKEQTDKKLDVIEDDIADIYNSFARADQVTVVKDSEGNLLRELVIDPSPNYYTQEEADELHEKLKAEVDNQFDEIELEIDEVKTELKDTIDANKRELNDALESERNLRSEEDERITGLVNALRDEHTGDIANINELITSTKSELEGKINSQLSELEKKHEEDIATIDSKILDASAEFNSQLSELKQKHTEDISNVNSNINSVKSELEGKIEDASTQFNNQLSELEQKHTEDISNVSSNINSAKSELEGKIEDTSTEFSNKLSSLQLKHDEDIASVNSNIEDKILDVSADLNSKFEELKTDIEGNVKSDLESIGEKIENVSSNVNDISNNIAENYLTKKQASGEYAPLTAIAETYVINPDLKRNRGYYSKDGVKVNDYAAGNYAIQLNPEDYEGYNYFKFEGELQGKRFIVCQTLFKEGVQPGDSFLTLYVNRQDYVYPGENPIIKIEEGTQYICITSFVKDTHPAITLYKTPNFYNKEEIDSRLEDYLKISDYNEYDDTDIDNRLKTLESIDHSKYLTEHQSLADYYTKSETESYVDEKVEEIEEKVKDIDLTPYLSKTDASSLYQPKGEYLTEHQSLEDYYTKSETEGYVQSYVDEKVDDIDFTPYLTKTDASSLYQPKGTYLTEHQSLVDYAKIEYVDGEIESLEAVVNRKLESSVLSIDQYNSLKVKDKNTLYIVLK